MFTGIITDIGNIMDVTPLKAGVRLSIASSYAVDFYQLGDSIACNGVCLTVTAKDQTKEGSAFEVELSPETLKLTTANSWRVGANLNLEQALKAGDALGGHIVSGHVDGLGEIQSIEDQADFHVVSIAVPKDLMPFMAKKGSVAVDGVSLTVNEVEEASIELTIIPHTWEETVFKGYKKGTKVNLEIDVIARYVARQMESK